MSLTTKNVFITGAAGGLGKAYMEALLQKGARVVFGDIDEKNGKKTEEEMNSKYGADKVLFILFSVTNDTEFKEAFNKGVSHLGFIDLMINNAGILDDTKLELSTDINFTGMARGTLLAEDHMRKDRGGRGGRIINCSSLAGTYRKGSFMHPIYQATKHAIRVFTEALADAPDIKEQGIEYGVLCPCPVLTTNLFQQRESKVRFPDIHKEIMDMVGGPAEKVVLGMMKLATMDNLNGATLEVMKEDFIFVKVDREVLGSNFPVSTEEDKNE